MRVPVTPQTAVPEGALGYEKAVDVTAGQRALAAVVGKYAEYAEQENKKRELFDVQKRVVDETNNIQQDFEDKTKVQPLGAPNFTQQVAGEYSTRHANMVQELKDKGYSDDAVNEFATRLGSIRSQYVGRAIDFQEKSNYAKVGSDTKAMAVGLSQYVGKNPDALPSALTEFRAGLKNSGLSEPEQLAMFEDNKGVILKGAQEGFAIAHPEVVLGLYGFPNELTTTSPEQLPGGQQFDLPSYIAKNSKAEGTGKNPKSSANGFFQFTKGTWLDYYKQVNGNTGESDAQIIAKRKDLGVATKLMEAFTNTSVQKLTAAHLPVNDGTVYLSHFLDPDVAIKVLSAHADEAIGNLVSSKAIAANPDVFKKVKTAGDMIAWAQARMGIDPTDVPVALKPIPADWKGNQEDAIQELGMTADQAAEFLRTGRDTRTPTKGPAPDQLQAALKSVGIEMGPDGRTGIPALDLSSGPERIQMLTVARTIMNERESDAKSAQREAHNTWLNGFFNQLQDGKLGQADLDAAYNNGQITDFDERRKAQGILDAKNKKDDDLTRYSLMLKSGQKFNPYDDDAQKAADAGYAKAVEYATKNGIQTSPMQIALREWQRIGILPKAGALAIRGGLISTDVNEVAAAASVASNMLVQNPNAFAGVEGEGDIGKAASNYSHYIDDLGMTAEAAAKKIALENSPEFQEKIKVDQPLREKFIESITGRNVNGKLTGQINIDKSINDAIFGERGWGSTLTFHHFDPTRGSFTSEAQRSEARQTFLELALDSWDKNHDAAAATAYAQRQMSRFYGVEGDRLLKYPATKAYPEIMGSRDYVFDQAAKLVSKSVGFDVPVENVWLQPTSTGSTANAFRAGKAPPYEVYYKTQVNGQDVYHNLPGKVFVADIDEARRAAAVEARKIEERHRHPVVFPGIGEIR